jgi:hypothetical protein
MELLLNLAWVLLGLPGYWLWRRGAGARRERRVTAPQFLLALACVLVLLFPVISASDDLHAMRAEVEDSSISKRTVRQTGGDKTSAWVNRLQGPPAMVARASWIPVMEVRVFEGSVAHVSQLSRPCVLNAGRAPPFSLPG